MRNLSWITLALISLGDVATSGAATPSTAVSFDLYDGPSGQETRSVLGLGDLAFGGTDLLAGAMRFDNTTVGPGYGLVGGGGVPLGGPASLRVLATRFIGDRDYRAWRLKTGPQWSLPGGGMLGVFWVHDRNNLGPDTESGVAELTTPTLHRWSGKLSGAYGRSEDVDGYSVAAGATWAPVPHLELGGELGAARNPPATAPGPTRGLLEPVLGGGGPAKSPESNALAATTSVSVRFTFP